MVRPVRRRPRPAARAAAAPRSSSRSPWRPAPASRQRRPAAAGGCAGSNVLSGAGGGAECGRRSTGTRAASEPHDASSAADMTNEAEFAPSTTPAPATATTAPAPAWPTAVIAVSTAASVPLAASIRSSPTIAGTTANEIGRKIPDRRAGDRRERDDRDRRVDAGNDGEHRSAHEVRGDERPPGLEPVQRIGEKDADRDGRQELRREHRRHPGGLARVLIRPDGERDRRRVRAEHADGGGEDEPAELGLAGRLAGAVPRVAGARHASPISRGSDPASAVVTPA